jgi:hypothetical protein
VLGGFLLSDLVDVQLRKLSLLPIEHLLETFYQSQAEPHALCEHRNVTLVGVFSGAGHRLVAVRVLCFGLIRIHLDIWELNLLRNGQIQVLTTFPLDFARLIREQAW